MKVAMRDVIIFSLVCGIYNLPIDSDDDSTQRILEWLHHNHYYTGRIDGLSSEEMALEMATSLMKMKKFYGLNEPVDGSVTPEVMQIIEETLCSKADLKGRSEKQRFKRWSRYGRQLWRKMPVEISFKNFDYKHPELNEGHQRQIMKECAEYWSQESGISFKLLAKMGGGNIEVEYRSIDGRFNTIGKAQTPKPSSSSPSYIHLDSAEHWKGKRRYITRVPHLLSLKWAMCHELGHTIGIGHSRERSAMMYHTIDDTQDEDRISDDDKDAVQALYGPRGDQTVYVEPGFVAPNQPSTTTTTTTTTTTSTTPRPDPITALNPRVTSSWQPWKPYIPSYRRAITTRLPVRIYTNAPAGSTTPSWNVQVITWGLSVPRNNIHSISTTTKRPTTTSTTTPTTPKPHTQRISQSKNRRSFNIKEVMHRLRM